MQRQDLGSKIHESERLEKLYGMPRKCHNKNAAYHKAQKRDRTIREAKTKALISYREADLRLCFRICKKPVFYIPSFVKIGPPVLEKKSLRVFTIYGRGGHSGHVTQMPRAKFRSPYPRRLHIKFGFDRSSGFEDV